MSTKGFSRRRFGVGMLGAASIGLLPTMSDSSRADAAPQPIPRRRLEGDSIQVDPSFGYYQGRTPQSIADELVQNGYRVVHYFVVNENDVNGELIDALHDRDIAVWALVLGNGSYSVDRFPAEWPEWQMELITPVDDGFYRFSMHSEAYTTWKKQALAELVARYRFDGLEIAECYFPEWDSIARGYYGDVGPIAQRAFQEAYDLAIPNFTDPVDPAYYRNDTDRYEKWVQFRVDAVNHFLDELINGEDGVRAARSDIRVATWSLGIDAGPDSVARLREFQGLDAPSMISAVRPDLHFIQTHWPDWVRPDLPADYAKTYQAFVDAIRAVHPKIGIGVQTDIGSQPAMARSADWMTSFRKTVRELGCSTWTGYEYHLGGYMYDELPSPTVGVWADGDLHISFQKRISADSARLGRSFAVYEGDHLQHWVDPNSVQVDGNRITIAGRELPPGRFRLRVENVTDDPATWLYHKDAEPNRVRPGTYLTVGPR